MRVAFAYIDVLPEHRDFYRTLCEGLVDNLRSVFHEKPIHITNSKTGVIDGCDGLMVDDDLLPMTWRMLAHYRCHDASEEILFTEPDVRFNENILHLFDQDFDVAVTDRDAETTINGAAAEIQMPYTQGSTLSRNREFWKDAYQFCALLDRKKQLWFGDMLALAATVNSGNYRIKVLPASLYNHVPESEFDVNAPVVHYKGKRKKWLFSQVSEVLEK